MQSGRFFEDAMQLVGLLEIKNEMPSKGVFGMSESMQCWPDDVWSLCAWTESCKWQSKFERVYAQ